MDQPSAQQVLQDMRLLVEDLEAAVGTGRYPDAKEPLRDLRGACSTLNLWLQLHPEGLQ